MATFNSGNHTSYFDSACCLIRVIHIRIKNRAEKTILPDMFLCFLLPFFNTRTFFVIHSVLNDQVDHVFFVKNHSQGCADILQVFTRKTNMSKWLCQSRKKNNLGYFNHSRKKAYVRSILKESKKKCLHTRGKGKLEDAKNW